MRKNSFLVLGSLIVSALLFLTSCGNRALFDDNLAIQNEIWTPDNNAIFKVDVKDTIHAYKFMINVRHTVDYRFSNLYVFMNTRFPNGNITRDTIECVLAAPDGKWMGKGFGELKQNQILLNSALRFPLKGEYAFEIEQGMRVKELKGITDIGIRIEKSF
jgi:gliding motility-associated lipoprotein GldH